MIERLSGMEALLCWRPRYSRLSSHNDSATTALNNQINSMDTTSVKNTSISIIKNIEAPADVLDPLTLASSWFLPKVSRTKAEEILATSPIGSFLLRASSSPSSAFALSVRVEEARVQHHLLLLAVHRRMISLITAQLASLLRMMAFLAPPRVAPGLQLLVHVFHQPAAVPVGA